MDRGLRLGIRTGDWLGFEIEEWRLVLGTGIGNWDLNWILGFENSDRGLGSETEIGIGD